MINSAVTAEVIRSSHLFADLPCELIDALSAIAVLVEKPANCLLFLEGDPVPGLYVTLTGHIKVSRIAQNGREQVVTVSSPGQSVNLVPVFDGGVCPANAETMEDARLLLFHTDDLHVLIQRHPELGLVLLRDLSSFMRKLVNLVDDLALHSVQGRLARLLLNFADDALSGQPCAPFTHADLAAQLGTVREKVSRTLKSFETLGLIKCERGLIRVIDRSGLEAQVEN